MRPSTSARRRDAGRCPWAIRTAAVTAARCKRHPARGEGRHKYPEDRDGYHVVDKADERTSTTIATADVTKVISISTWAASGCSGRSAHRWASMWSRSPSGVKRGSAFDVLPASACTDLDRVIDDKTWAPRARTPKAPIPSSITTGGPHRLERPAGK